MDFEILLRNSMRGPPKNTVHRYLKNTYINYKFQDCYQIYDLLRQLSYLIIQKNSLIKSFKIGIKFIIFHALQKVLGMSGLEVSRSRWYTVAIFFCIKY